MRKCASAEPDSSNPEISDAAVAERPAYGRFKPGTEGRDHWERIAAASDAEKWPAKGAVEGAAPEKQT